MPQYHLLTNMPIYTWGKNLVKVTTFDQVKSKWDVKGADKKTAVLSDKKTLAFSFHLYI